MTNLQAVHLVVMFGFNYPHNFISKIWTGSLAKHIQSKFDGFYSQHGSIAVFNVFYCSLDSDNQKLLINYILENYKG
jgi:ABC-type uncharacterized transport system YnjBCD substrate-binding protein